jgi:hypothetical protein
MMMDRLPTKLWVDALIRRVQVGGAAAFVVQEGDEHRGDVLVKVARLDGTAAVYSPTMDMEGERIFINLIVQGIGPDEAGVDAYVRKARERDRDLWIIEIEDREGRHFLTEPVDPQAPL